MEKQQFADSEKVDELIPESEEEEILSANETSLEMLVVILNWTLISAVITGSIWGLAFNAPPPGSPDAPTQESQMSSLRYTLSRGVLLVGSLLSFCVALIIGLGKNLMRQYTLTLILPPYGPRRLPKHRAQSLRAIPTSVPTWFMQLLKTLRCIFPVIQFVITIMLLVLYWFF
ncbi:uncharacterized protein BJ212DRAFT_1485233 [Suillus subaureus]|uniref:Transmembrane protein n=1 Tax=Suillus subaureus TaxID=48587 RepID=A0A9P7J8G3_9AGAM|nr:uncharacterized protein BJ212DRAFT_1485233 [Suillus subaureus]KAG1807953.1 hypothetical protein BJ212DRAFT_1485233 [Suillus subaureus]